MPGESLVDKILSYPERDTSALPLWRQIVWGVAWLATAGALFLLGSVALLAVGGVIYACISLVARLLGADFQLVALLAGGLVSFALLAVLGVKLEFGLTYFACLGGAYAILGVVLATNTMGYALFVAFVAWSIYALVSTLRTRGHSLLRSVQEGLAILLARPVASTTPSSTAGQTRSTPPDLTARLDVFVHRPPSRGEGARPAGPPSEAE